VGGLSATALQGDFSRGGLNGKRTLHLRDRARERAEPAFDWVCGGISRLVGRLLWTDRDGTYFKTKVATVRH
jgi:hypothetical protein